MRRGNLALLLVACLAVTAAHAAAAGDDLDGAWAAELQPVAAHGRALLQSASPPAGGYGGYGTRSGGYGGNRRRLIEGQYGGDGRGGYGYGSSGPRVLLEEEEEAGSGEAEAMALEQQQQQPEEEGYQLEIAPQQVQQSLQRAAQQQADPQGSSAAQTAAPSAAVAAAMRSARAAAANSALASPAGTCYCRYDTDYNSWALGEQACKSALYTKCAARQLPCSWLDHYYSHAMAATGAHALPHEQDILAFVFDDCQPQPPCACATVKFDGRDPVSSTYACCRDLRAACRTPFDGLSCRDVEAFCGDDAASPQLLRWAHHKLRHGALECTSYAGVPYNFVLLEATAAAHRAKALTPTPQAQRSEAAAAVAQVGAALRDAAARGLRDSRISAAAVCVGAALIAVAIVGMLTTLRGGGTSGEEEDAHTSGRLAPLLHTIPEVPEDVPYASMSHPVPSSSYSSS